MSARVWKKPGTKAVRLFSLFGLLRTASKATAPGLCPSVRPSNADAADSRQIYGGRERERERERETLGQKVARLMVFPAFLQGVGLG